MSPETLKFFAQLLDQVQIPATAPDFDETVALVSKVRRELADAIQAAAAEPTPE